MLKEYTGWLLDVYAGKLEISQSQSRSGDEEVEDGGRRPLSLLRGQRPRRRGDAWVWLLDEKDGTRRCFRQALPLAFHVSGPASRLRALWHYLESLPQALRPSHLSRNERCELFSDQLLTVLTVQVEHPAAQPALFRLVSRAFPDLAYYDADIPLALHHAARYSTFPLARCRLEVEDIEASGEVEESGEIRSLDVLNSPWELDPATLPLRYLTMQPDVDPSHTAPTHILLEAERASYHLALQPVRPLLVNLRAILLRHDPDLLLTTWGDTWLLPYLLELSKRYNLPLPLNRDPSFEPIHRKERTYFAYGQVIYRGRQVHLFGRWHVDRYNAVFYHDYGMEGIFELARVTSLPVQAVARLSPGSGISAMQVLTALREGILVPWHKQQAENPKTALELLRSDQGGLVYQPVIGLHRDVAEIDFVSMYPSIMARFNISPETVRKGPPSQEGLQSRNAVEGLVPKTLRPLLDKRISLKLRLAELPAWHPRRTAYKACALAHKWLLVTCFGYLGYKNARFGRIEAHEAVTAYGRELLMRAKEAAEEQGYEVLHLYVDGMWVRKPGHSRVPDFQPLLDEIAARTSLSIALDGVYRWVAFLPSRMDSRVPVPNRYFGVFQDGSLKMRGIEARRQDTPPWIVRIQVAMLDCLASHHAAGSPGQGPRQPDLYGNDLPECLPRLERLLRKACSDLQRGRVPLAELLVSQKLSRELEEYTVPSPAARAAAQLAAIGKHLRPGQRVRFMYTLGKPGVRAWDLPETFNPATIDRRYYRQLLLRAASSVLQPFGIELVNFTASEGYLCKTS